MSETISQMALRQDSDVDVTQTYIPAVVPDASSSTGFANCRVLATTLAGAKWYTGTGVPDSALGLNDDWYLCSANGYIYQKMSGAWSYVLTIKGTNGTNGTDGTDGVGVPTGGDTDQVLAKNSATNYDTKWVNQSGGSGSGCPDYVLQNLGVI